MKIINIKPLSVNDAWRGRQFSTKMKTEFEKNISIHLFGSYIDIKPPYHVIYQFHIPKLQDLDNCIKVFQDCMTKHYGFNDRDIYKISAEKIPVKSGEEKICFDIIQYKGK